QGGISQLETFDPHPDSPISFGSKSIPTSISGIQFGVGLERTAELAEDFSVLRSVVSEEGDHARAIYNTKTGYRPFPGIVHPSIGAILCHELPNPISNGLEIDIPAHVSIVPAAFPARGGYLGAEFDAFQIGDPVNPVPDIRSLVPDKREQRRLAGLDLLENSFAKGRLPDLEGARTLHQTSMQKALSMMSSEQLAAFDIKERPKAERDAFGDTAFGRGCLAAIGLVEAGVRCVEVTLNGWDTHVNNHEGQRSQNAILDPAFSATLRVLKERDLFDDTIVLLATEFGRTPKLNLTEGRDHWPHAFSMAIGGGGLRGGLAVGETDPSGEKSGPGRRILVEDIHATILHRLGVIYESEITTPIGRPIALSEGRLIRELL
ncbi:MAG: DUF1501 domain-containing protein, partial [Verrucomicrobiota bacterium]